MRNFSAHFFRIRNKSGVAAFEQTGDRLNIILKIFGIFSDVVQQTEQISCFAETAAGKKIPAKRGSGKQMIFQTLGLLCFFINDSGYHGSISPDF